MIVRCMAAAALMMALAFAPSSAFAEDGWLTQDVTSNRFAEGQTPGPALTAGTKVEVLVRDGDLARVMAGSRVGWVPAAAVSATDPAAVPDVAPDAPVTPPQP